MYAISNRLERDYRAYRGVLLIVQETAGRILSAFANSKFMFPGFSTNNNN